MNKIVQEHIARRLREISAVVADRGEAAHAAAKESAAKIKDEVMADFMRRESEPAYILGAVQSIRRLSELGALDEAYRQLEYLDTRLEFIGQIVRTSLVPALETGIKQRTWLEARRNAGNEQKARDAAARHAEWQAEASPIWQRHPDWGALPVAELVKKNLGLSESVGTIRKAIKKPVQ